MKVLIGVLGALAFITVLEQSLLAQTDTQLDEVLARLDAIEKRLSNLEHHSEGSAPHAATGIETQDIAVRLEAIDEQVRILDRRRELDQEAVTSRFSQAPVVEAGREGFSLRSPDSAFQFKIGGYFQADGRFFAGPRQVESSTFILRRIRPVLTGTFYKGIEFRLMPDWGQGTTVLQDLHLDFRFFPKVSVRFGKFKSPFSLERLQSATDLTFVERAFPTNLAPNRDTGVQVYGDFGSGTFSYAVAATNGVPDGGSTDLDSNDGKDFIGRVFFQPFMRRGADHKGSGLGFGLAASHGRQSGTNLPTYRTTPQSAFFSFANGVTADGDRKRLGPQGHYYVGSFGLFAEYTVTAQDVRQRNTAITVRADGWQVAASYFLTGERKGYRNPGPTRAFDRAGGRGALEVAARYTELSIGRNVFQAGLADSTRSARKEQEWTAGITWHVTRGNKFVFNYSQTHFTEGSNTGNRSSEEALLSRFQVAF
jgi:phosphate-selective porin OprO/OprP